MKPTECNVYYADNRSSLVIDTDLVSGWRRLEKAYGFNHQTKIPFRNDLSIRAQLTVIAQPASFEEWAQNFSTLDMSSGNERVKFELSQGRLKVKVALSADQTWRIMSSGRPGLFLEELPFLKYDSTRWYELRAWTVSRGSKAPDT